MIRILVILGLLCLYLPAQTADPAGVIFPETTYDFGTVKQGSIVVHSFAVKNIGTAPVTIKNVQLSIPGMNARFRPVLAPDSEGTITLGWDTSHSTGEMDGEATVLFSDGSEQRETLLLKGIVRPPLEILPYPAIFLSAFHGEDTECRLKIVNNVEEPVAISLSATEGKHFVASLTTVQPGKVYELVARIPSAALPGRYDEELALSTSNPKLAGFTIPVHVFVKPDLYANPATRELSTQTFLVKKRNGEFEINKVESDLEGLEVRKDPPRGKSSTYRVDVALDPQKLKPGKIAGFVKIFTNDQEFPLIKIPVRGSPF